jgi:hypothetical protein
VAVYLIHFERPIADGHPCRHYLGFALSVPKRVECHARGNGARLVEVAMERGIEWEIARVWPKGTRTFERQLKNQKNAPGFCPVCKGRPDHRLRRYNAGTWIARGLRALTTENT